MEAVEAHCVALALLYRTSYFLFNFVVPTYKGTYLNILQVCKTPWVIFLTGTFESEIKEIAIKNAFALLTTELQMLYNHCLGYTLFIKNRKWIQDNKLKRTLSLLCSNPRPSAVWEAGPRPESHHAIVSTQLNESDSETCPLSSSRLPPRRLATVLFHRLPRLRDHYEIMLPNS